EHDGGEGPAADRDVRSLEDVVEQQRPGADLEHADGEQDRVAGGELAAQLGAEQRVAPAVEPHELQGAPRSRQAPDEQAHRRQARRARFIRRVIARVWYTDI